MFSCLGHTKQENIGTHPKNGALTLSDACSSVLRIWQAAMLAPIQPVAYADSQTVRT